jgi:hypothetical protein
MTQTITAVPTELKDLLTDIGDKTASGTQLHEVGIHSSIIPTEVDGLRPHIPQARGKLWANCILKRFRYATFPQFLFAAPNCTPRRSGGNVALRRKKKPTNIQRYSAADQAICVTT